MSRQYSPKEVSLALGVSESSLKRWVDKGVIRGAKTAGGHRRLSLSGVMDYLRSSGRKLRQPMAIDLPDGCGCGESPLINQGCQQFRDALVTGGENAACRIILDLYISGVTVAAICDLVIAEAFHEIGDLWKCGELEIYEERRACEICQRVIHELRRAVGEGNPQGPIALGATVDGDPYTLSTCLAELVLRNVGWKANSLGNSLPFESIRNAILDERPKLFWISVTNVLDSDRFVADFNMLFDVAQSTSTALVIGGQGLTTELLQRIRYTFQAETFQQMESFADALRSSSGVPV